MTETASMLMANPLYRILAGTNEIMKELIARDLEKRLT